MKRDLPPSATAAASAAVPQPDAAWFAQQSRALRHGASTQGPHGTHDSHDLAAHCAVLLQLSPEAALHACAEAAQLPVFDAARLYALVPDFELLPLHDAARRVALAGRDAQGLWIVIDDPFDTDRADWLEHRAQSAFQYALADGNDIRAALKRNEASLRATDGALAGVVPAADAHDHDGGERPDLTLGGIEAEASPVVRLVNSLLYDALKAEASDVHLESDIGGMSIKVRVDGVLDPAGRIDGRATADQVISRIKVLAELDIAERRVPQDGRFQVLADGREIDLRVSVMPAVHAEDAVIRILDRQRLTSDMQGLRFATLGFDAQTVSELQALSRLPYGLMLVTGPTGSGKTTTLYAALSEINDGLEKIITIEDPVEYQLPGIVQIPVNEKRGLTFSRGLRSILRHDPDKIMVGEIRDAETGQIAVQAALTGHLVFTTLHANSAFDVIGRMLHIGVDPFNLVSALNGVVAQRLVRLSCSHCKQPVKPDLSRRPAAERARLAGLTLFEGIGCGHCRGTGYRGRRAVAEVLTLDDALRDAIAARQSIATMKAVARSRHMRTIRGAALDLVAEDLTTLAELDRVTFADPDGEGTA